MPALLSSTYICGSDTKNNISSWWDKCWHDLSSPHWCTNKNKSCLKDKLHHPCGNPWSTCFYYNSWGNSRASIWDGLNFRDSLFPMLVCGDNITSRHRFWTQVKVHGEWNRTPPRDQERKLWIAAFVKCTNSALTPYFTVIDENGQSVLW
jgi:hypothetical protein